MGTEMTAERLDIKDRSDCCTFSIVSLCLVVIYCDGSRKTVPPMFSSRKPSYFSILGSIDTFKSNFYHENGWINIFVYHAGSRDN